MAKENTSVFWDKFAKLCKEQNMTAKEVSKKIGISATGISGWKKGAKPSGEAVFAVADVFGVSAEYLLDDEEISIKPSMKRQTIYGGFQDLRALPQRFLSLRHGIVLNDDEIYRILKFVGLPILSCVSYTSYDEFGLDRSSDNCKNDLETLFKILGLMDWCAESKEMKMLQEQLSMIVLHRIDDRLGEKYALLSEKYHIDQLMDDKLRYLYYGDLSTRPEWRYGLNFSELNTIREEYGISFPYMFTGHEFSEITQI